MQSANLTAEYEFTAFFGYVKMGTGFNQKGKITHADAF